MTITDPSTQVYQAVLKTLMAFPPLAANLRTVQNPADPANFQQFLVGYQAGDTPAMLLKPVSNIRKFFALNSRAFSWTEEIGVALSTDSQNIQPINVVNWQLSYALAYAERQPNIGKNFGITAQTNGFNVISWDLVGGKMDLGSFQSEMDSAAGGAQRWRAVAIFRIQCGMGWDQLQEQAAALINAGQTAE
jgi:hypothetical protein